jgi:hypothetical protein
MGCDSSYLQANAQEMESRLVALHLVYVFTALKQLKSITPEIKAAAKDYYGNIKNLNQDTALLCSTLKGLSKADTDKIVYDARNARSRALASWWEDHQAHDRQRDKDVRDKKNREEGEARAREFLKLPVAKQKAILAQHTP